MDCPKCTGKLQEKTITVTETHKSKTLQGVELRFDLTLDQCFVCGGVWSDRDELQKYQEKLLVNLNSPSLGADIENRLNKKKGKCPVCAIEMEQKPLPDIPKILIDACSKCGGIWLDGAEIDRIEKLNPKTEGPFFRFLTALLPFRKQNPPS